MRLRRRLLLSFAPLFWATAACGAEPEGFAPVIDSMTRQSEQVVVGEVTRSEGGDGDLKAIIHDGGNTFERMARIIVLSTLKGDIPERRTITVAWFEGGGVPLAKARIQKGKRYLFFLRSYGACRPEGKGEPETTYLPIDPVAGILPADPWAISLFKSGNIHL